MLASATPVIRFVAPGPKSGQTDARFAGQPAVDIGHEGGGLLVPGGDEFDGAFQQGIHDVEVFLAGQAEKILHPFVFQATHKEFGSFHGRS